MIYENNVIEFSLHKNLETALLVGTPTLFEDKDWDKVTIGENMKVAPWGVSNDLPKIVMEHIEKSDVMGSNLTFNTNVCYGLGPKLVRHVTDKKSKIVDVQDVLSGKEYDFFFRNDLEMYMMQNLTDMNYFHNSFAELIPDASWKEIYSLRNLEAAFSRWRITDKNEIMSHLYCSKWHDNPAKADIRESIVLDEFDTLNHIERLMKGRIKQAARWVYPAYMASPGHYFYSRPSWYSLFSSGWYDLSIAVAEVKKTILKNQLGVKFIIAISPKYFTKRAKDEGIDEKDVPKMKELVNGEVEKLNTFLSGEGNFSKALVTLKEMMPTGNGVTEEQYISITPVNNKFGQGEFIEDSETAANVICYAMNIHPSLIGATPGKSSSMSGTDKRELFLIKQALSRPLINRSLRVLQFIKKVNKWDEDIRIELPEFLFTTLDQDKSGKKETTNSKI